MKRTATKFQERQRILALARIDSDIRFLEQRLRNVRAEKDKLRRSEGKSAVQGEAK